MDRQTESNGYRVKENQCLYILQHLLETNGALYNILGMCSNFELYKVYA